jgi:hypothetical protein
MISMAYPFRKYGGAGALMLALVATIGVLQSEPAQGHGLVMYATDGAPVARYHLETAWPSKLKIGA